MFACICAAILLSAPYTIAVVSDGKPEPALTISILLMLNPVSVSPFKIISSGANSLPVYLFTVLSPPVYVL